MDEESPRNKFPSLGDQRKDDLAETSASSNPHVTAENDWYDAASRLADAIESDSVEQLEGFLQQLPAEQWARAVSRLDEVQRIQLFETIAPEQAAELIEELTETQAIDVMENVSASNAAAILEELESDQQADILHELETADAEAIMAAMQPAAAAQARHLVGYPPDTAGGLMITELLCFGSDLTVADVLDDLRSNNEQYSDYEVQYAYVIQATVESETTTPHFDQKENDGVLDKGIRPLNQISFGRLVGVLRLRDLLLSSPDKPIVELMIVNPLSVQVNDDLDHLVDFFDQHTFLGVPVVNLYGDLLGVVRQYDLEAARADRADDDNLKILGIIGGEELRTMPLVTRTVKRLSWLIPNIILNLFAVSVIALYESTIEQVVALAILLPLISDMGGNAGVQAIAVSIRELNQGLVRAHELMWVALRESSVGLLSGLVLGSLIAVGSYLWKQNIYLALVMGGSMLLNNVVATIIGGVMPLILKRMNIDPALASGPLLTTITDMAGFAFVLSFATAVLPYLIV